MFSPKTSLRLHFLLVIVFVRIIANVILVVRVFGDVIALRNFPSFLRRQIVQRNDRSSKRTNLASGRRSENVKSWWAHFYLKLPISYVMAFLLCLEQKGSVVYTLQMPTLKVEKRSNIKAFICTRLLSEI